MRVIDLAHVIEEGMTAYCDEESASIKQLSTIDNDGYNVLKIQLSTHTGTHIDSPNHIFKDGITVDEFDINKFIGNAYLIDCSDMEEIDLDTILKHEGEIRSAEYLILRTGWESKWNKETYFKDYPTLSYEASKFLSELENLNGIGIDCISVDNEEGDLYNHKNLLSKGKIIIENICNLSDVEKRFKIIVSPLKLKDADGAPSRIYALIE
ncbi:cyclase family protein [Clostridium sardiniense]|uniref:cyclase family protein n=1 Tax=Clostridium sardiniense TaxID=29369 RepID=UPI003D352661